MKTQKLIHLVIVIVCFVSWSIARAVNPPPDGGYPNFTTAEGTNALKNLTSGAANTAVGWYSLFSDTTGSFNTAAGAGTLVLNTGDENTAIGAAALLFNTASGNTAVGSRALLNNTTGGTVGNIQGFDVGPNVAVGQQALESNSAASANTAVGYQALKSFTNGPVGFEEIGLSTAVGFQALANATGDGNANSGFGYQALIHNTEGFLNTAIGLQTLFSNTFGGNNTAVGTRALALNTDGDNNTAIGLQALLNNTTGANNIALGPNAGGGVSTASNVICIGANGANTDNGCYIGNIFNVPNNGTAVFIDANHKLGTMTSSKRFKEDIKPMEQASEVIYQLRPVSFRYKREIEPTRPPSFGLIAEEVQAIHPDLVARDKEGQPYSVRYDHVNAMLLNEFLKEHRKGEEQHLAISQLKSALAQQQKTFEAKFAQQDQQIAELMANLQRLAADIELKKAESRAIANK